MACLFAATYPERTRCLVLWGAQARWTQSADYPWGQTPEEDEALYALLRREWPSVEYVTGVGAGLGKQVNPAYLDWMLRYGQAAASPGAIVLLEQMNAKIDIRDILPWIRVPTLVMNRLGDPMANIEAARDLAEHIPDATLVEFPGDTHSMLGPDAELVLAEIERFVTGSVAPKATSRMLATLVFVDIVSSTERAQSLGDAAWRLLLERFYSLIETQVAQCGGIEVDRAGDGVLARFDGPTRGIRYARVLQREAAELGLSLRAGVHTGEVELIGRDVSGITVHIAARIAALASADEVFVSSTVVDLVAGSDLEFDDLGVHKLKGVTEPRQVFAVLGPGPAA